MKYKVFHIGTFIGNHVSDHYRDAGFSKFFKTKIYDYRKVGRVDTNIMFMEMHNIILDFDPDIIFINKGEIIPSYVVKRWKMLFPHIFIVNFNGDQRGKIQEFSAEIANYSDALLINNKDKKRWNEYYSAGVNKIYEYHTATDVSTFKPHEENKLYDIFFAGGNYGTKFPLSKFRLDCIKELSRNFNIAIAGSSNWKNFPVNYVGHKYGVDYAKLCSMSKCVLGINAYNDIENYTSNRTWNSMACGSPYVCHNYSGVDKFFKDGEDIIIFNNINDLIQKVKWILNNKNVVDIIGKNAVNKIRQFHTYDYRAKQLLEIYENWKIND